MRKPSATPPKTPGTRQREDHPFPKGASEPAGNLSLGKAATYPVELHVEAAGVADRLALRVPAPQGGGCGVAVGTGQA